MDYNPIKIFINLEIIREEDKNKKNIFIFKKNLKIFYNLGKSLNAITTSKSNFYYIVLVLCPCNARLNQNSYVNNFLLIYLK